MPAKTKTQLAKKTTDKKTTDKKTTGRKTTGKKTTGKKAKVSDRKARPLPGDAQYNLKQLVQQVRRSKDYAGHIRNLLRTANANEAKSTAAQDELERIFQPDNEELEQMHYPEKDWPNFQKCTDQNKLVSAWLLIRDLG